MKKNWLRGLLLGLSMALLLTGGIALAQSLQVTPDCFQCFPGSKGEFVDQQPGFPYSYRFNSCGWEPGEPLATRETFANGGPPHYSPGNADGLGCISSGGPWGWTCEGDPAHHTPEADAAPTGFIFPDDYWGPFEFCVGPMANPEVSANAIVCRTILFAEVCEVEFVPEPGSILLLGSGLAGLAGYAALRWRTRAQSID